MSRQRSIFRFPVVLLVLAVVIGTTILFYSRWQEGRTTGKGNNSPANPEAEAGGNQVGGNRAGGIEVYFSNTYDNDPLVGKNDDQNIDRHVAEFIRSAKSSLDVALFELESARLSDALIDAHRRGVRVRVVGDSEYGENEEMQSVIAAGIPVVFDERSALMHNKFVVVDGARIWTGSFNATDNCSFRNNNNGLAISSSELAENYATEFAEMFERGEFGPRSTSNTPHTLVKVGGADIYNYFSPEDDLPPKVIRYLRAANKSIHFMAFSFSDDAIAQAVIDRHRDGIQVEGVVESLGSDAKGAEMPNLQAAGIAVLKDGNKYKLHHKVFIIDGLWTITGSYNFTASGAKSNDENILIIKSAEVARQFEAEYQRVKGMAMKAGA